MTGTYGDMKSRIADDLARTDLTSQIAQEILSAVKFYERQRFYFNVRVTDTFALVANQEYYGSSDLAAIPNLITIDDMYVTVDGLRYHVIEAPFQDIADAQNGLVTRDPPFRFAYYAQQIRMYPIPSAARTVTMADHYRLTALSSDSDTNAWTTDAEELIRNRAERILYSKIIKDMDAANEAAANEQEALRALKRETKLRTTPSELSLPGELVGSRGSDIRAGF